MPQAAKWFDPVIGIDIHMVMVPVPGGRVPVPLPHPFIGFVFDPVGEAVGAVIAGIFGGGGVRVNGLPAANAGTDVKALIKHFPTPPGTGFAPCDAPDNKGTFITGSETVTFAGSSASRTGSMVSTCNFPLNLPTSTCIAIPLGSPTLVGGGESVNVMAAVMRGIQTKWFSSLLHAILKPGPRLSKLICFLTGHPVDVMTGEVLTDAVDVELPGPWPFKWERNYYSRSRYQGSLGQGWTHSLDLSVTEAESEIVVRLWDGRERQHDPLAVGESLWDDVDRYALQRVKEGYVLTTGEGVTYVFAPVQGPRRAPLPGVDGLMADANFPTHRLVAIQDRCGNAISLSYTLGKLIQVVDSAGRVLSVRWIKEGQVEGVYFEDRPLVRYSYDADGMLAAAQDPAGNAATYGYKARLLVRDTNKNGFSFHFEYDWEDPDGWCVRTWGDGGLYERKLTYDKYRHTTIVDDGRGGRTQYFAPYSGAAGLVDKIVDPMGVETRFEWNQQYRKVAEVDGLGHRTEWTYDERGNVVREKNALGEVTQRKYTILNLPEEVTDAAGATWRLDHDHRGKVTRVTSPDGAERRAHHDERGLLVQMSDPLGRATKFAYSLAGDLVACTDAEGGTSTFRWDSLGRLCEQNDPLGHTTKFQVDLCGRVIAVQRPNETSLRFSYDAEGNVTEKVDALGHVTTYKYAGFNKLVEQVDPAGHSIKYLYDVEEDLIALVNEGGEKYTLLVDKAGRVIKEVGFDGRTLLFRYDRAGRCHETADAEGRITRLTRDALGRVVKRLIPKPPTLFAPIPAPEIVEYKFDARGDLVMAKNEAAEVKFERDMLGRIVREITNDVVVESAYGSAGERVRRTTSLGHVTEYDVDGRGLLRGLSLGSEVGRSQAGESEGAPPLPPKAPWPLRIVRDAEGSERTRTLPGGVTAKWDRDAAGRPGVQRIARNDVALFGRGYQWRTDEQLAAIVDTEKGPTRFAHDERDFLVAEGTPDGRVQHRSPDATGNLYKTPKHGDRLYGHGGRIQLDGETQYVHDKDGNLVLKVDPDGKEWKYAWDGAGQLVRVTRPDGAAVEFAYDALGRRVKKTTGSGVTSFAWDGNDLLHEQRANSPTVTWVFEPDTFAPMAKVEGHGTATEKRWGIVTDHLGSPLAMMDEVGNLAWKGQLDAFGVLSTDVAKVDCALRWPGQYEDEETGLYYNRFRYYDPGLGRYVSQDPIGLSGGTALFGYVHDPLSWLDPFGLSACDKGTRQTRALTDSEILNHVFDRHAQDFLGNMANKGKDLGRLKGILDNLRKSGLTFPFQLGGTSVIGHLGRFEGKRAAIFFFDKGQYAGQVASAFLPTKKQLSKIFGIISRQGP